MKTIEQAQEDYVNNTFIEPDTYIGEIYNAFKSGVEFAQRWIPIEEDLPEIGEMAITKMTKDKRTSYGIATRIREEWQINAHWIDHTFSNMTITHWRPIEYK